MKIVHILGILFLASVAGCNMRSKEMEQRNAELQAQNSQLTQDLASRDAYIDTVTQSINDVYTSLESVRTREGMLLRQTNEMESARKLSNRELRQQLIDQIALIDSTVRDNRLRVADLQTKVQSARRQYAGLKKMVASLQQTVAERESTITQLQQRVLGLEEEVGAKTHIIAQRDSLIQEQGATIGSQHAEINRAYYIAGSRRDLESKGIITSQGGFLWGLLGSTTVLANGFDPKLFTPIDKFEQTAIEVEGDIRELVPKRNEEFYTAAKTGDHTSTLTISEPVHFWQERYLVIITD